MLRTTSYGTKVYTPDKEPGEPEEGDFVDCLIRFGMLVLARIEDSIEWLLDNSWVLVLGFCALILACILWAVTANNKLNASMIGKPRVYVVTQLGVPDKDIKADYRTEVMEWVTNYPGHTDVTTDSKGRVSTSYTPPQTYVRKAVLEDGICVSCEGF